MRCNISQVEFSDSLGSVDLAAVQVDEGSSYMAEDTSFMGFAAEVRVESNSYVGAINALWFHSAYVFVSFMNITNQIPRLFMSLGC